jgi:hypothetical protein
LVWIVGGRRRHSTHRSPQHTGCEFFRVRYLRSRGEGNSTELGEQVGDALKAFIGLLRQTTADDIPQLIGAASVDLRGVLRVLVEDLVENV